MEALPFSGLRPAKGGKTFPWTRLARDGSALGRVPDLPRRRQKSTPQPDVSSPNSTPLAHILGPVGKAGSGERLIETLLQFRRRSRGIFDQWQQCAKVEAMRTIFVRRPWTPGLG